MKIGIVTALAAEAETFAWPAGVLCGSHACTVRTCGVGPRQAEAAARACLAEGCDALVSWGLAGGLDAGLKPASLLVAGSVIDEDGACWPGDAELNALFGARLAGLGAVQRGLVSVAVPVATASAKHALHVQFEAAAVDMESAALARAAAAAGARFAAVRCIVDPAGFDLPRAALAGMRADGRTAVLATCAALLRRPRELGDLLRLAGWYRAALRQLARAARELAR